MAKRLSLAVTSLLSLVGLAACTNSGAVRSGDPVPSYDPSTGKLVRLEADLNHNGKPDSWTYMDGVIPLRTEQDLNEDGKIDRWEYVNPEAKLTKVLIAPSGDPKRITRWETYNLGVLELVEEDTNGDGQPDHWEKHHGVPILSAEFDTNFDGAPDRRLTFRLDGKVLLIETDPDGRGGYRKSTRPQ